MEMTRKTMKLINDNVDADCVASRRPVVTALLVPATLLLLVILGIIPNSGAAHPPPAVDLALRTADVIAEAETVDIRSRWEGGLIVSTVTARITRCLRGECAFDVADYEVYGGELDGLVQEVSGSKVPNIGQALVFLFVERAGELRLAHPALHIVTVPGEERSEARLLHYDISMEDFRGFVR